MTQSFEHKLIDDVATQIKSLGDQLHNTLPQAAMALNSIAMSVGMAGERYEGHRIDSIIKGTHPMLIPIRRMLHLQGLENESMRKYLQTDLALKPLWMTSADEVELAKQHTASEHKKLFKRFIGVWFRRKYLTRGIETDVGATSMFTGVQTKDIPYGVLIRNGDMVVQFEDTAKAFEHTLTLGKHYIQHDSNKYTIRSLWMDEEFSGIFDNIGWQWLQTYLMAPVSVSHGITLNDYVGVTDEEMVELVTSIPDSLSVQSWNKVTLYYPGDGAEFLPKCRVDISYHYYSGSDKHQLTIRVIPDDNLLALGLDGSPQRKDVMFTDAPTPIQEWIKMNIVEGFNKVIAEIKAEQDQGEE